MLLPDEFIGQKFGRLTVVATAPDHIDAKGKHRSAFICRCDCGRVVDKKRHYLQDRRVSTPSCGCVKCNKVKSNRDVNEFRNWIIQVYERSAKEKAL